MHKKCFYITTSNLHTWVESDPFNQVWFIIKRQQRQQTIQQNIGVAQKDRCEQRQRQEVNMKQNTREQLLQNKTGTK